MSEELIMVVDDNPVNLKLAQVLLSRKGFTVCTATDAYEARDMLKIVHPDLILMDIQLPGMDGLSLTRQLKVDPATQDICIVALTAYAMLGDEQKARDAGCDGYIPKPIDTRLFVSTVLGFLKDAQAARTRM